MVYKATALGRQISLEATGMVEVRREQRVEVGLMRTATPLWYRSR